MTERTEFLGSTSMMSRLELDTLNAYSRFTKPSPYLIVALRGVMMIFQQLLIPLWDRGFRFRIVPKGKGYHDLPELRSFYTRYPKKKKEDNEKASGLYHIPSRIAAVKEERLVNGGLTSQRFAVSVHEIAHGIWYLLLPSYDREEVSRIFAQEHEVVENGHEYRLTNPEEFFAESFTYYISPHRRGRLLGTHSSALKSLFPDCPPIEITETERVAESSHDRQRLKSVNQKMFSFLQNRFKGVIDPEIITSWPLAEDTEFCFEFWQASGLYLLTESSIWF